MIPIENNWTQHIGQMTEASDHLGFVKHVSQRFDFDTDFNKKIQVTLSAIQRRLNDKNLYVTIVGRASTGKSTFVNALLGDELLEAHVLQMTTTISTNVVYGDELAIFIQFKEESVEAAFSWWGLGILGGKRERNNEWSVRLSDGAITFKGEETNIRGLITKLTTSDIVAEYIDSLTIAYPSDFLKPGIVLIDTPGADATNPKHKENTREAVANADTAIIITPGEQAISGWLSDALADPEFLRPFLHRCVFVMTRMDIALERMRKTKRDEAIDLLYKDASTRLASNLTKIGITTQPNFYFCAAQSVLEAYTGDEQEDENIRYWREEFGKLKIELFNMMLNQRAESISESVLRLLEDLLQHMDVYLSEIWKAYNQRKGQLETTVRDLDTFCNEQKKAWKKKVKRMGNVASEEVEITVIDEQNYIIEYVENQVFNAESLNELNAVANNANHDIEAAVKRIEDNLKIQIGQISKDAKQFSREFDKQFSSLYQQLRLISENSVSRSAAEYGLESSGTKSLNIQSMASDSEAGGRFLGGAIVGGIAAAIIGISFFPVAIVGGLIALFNQPSLGDSKRKVWSEIEPKLRAFFSDLKNSTIEIIEDHQSELETQVNQYIKKYEKKYSEAVKKMKKDQDEERQNLIREQANIESTLQELKERRLRIQKLKDNLKLN